MQGVVTVVFRLPRHSEALRSPIRPWFTSKWLKILCKETQGKLMGNRSDSIRSLKALSTTASKKPESLVSTTLKGLHKWPVSQERAAAGRAESACQHLRRDRRRAVAAVAKGLWEQGRGEGSQMDYGIFCGEGGCSKSPSSYVAGKRNFCQDRTSEEAPS